MRELPKVKDESTEQVLYPEGEEYVSTSLELFVCEASGASWRVPLTRRSTRIAGPGHQAHLELPGSVYLKVSWMEQQLVFWSDPRGGATLVNGKPGRAGILNVGDSVSWEGYSVQVVDRAHQLRATLECVSSPFLARIWPIDEEATLIGRRGLRQNHVELEHPTISRRHATIFWQGSDARIQTDTQTSLVVVEGRNLPHPEIAPLLDGSNLQLGELTFRFRLLKELDPRLRGPRLNVYSLGVLRVERGQEPVAEKSWRTANVRWLMARLALDWGRPVSSDVLLALFWPGMPEASAKNNLNFCLSTLRSVLRSDAFPQVDYFLRSRSTIQIAPDLLGDHDYQELQETLSNARQLTSGERALVYWKRALDQYRGEYLEGCFMEWAQQVRQRLHQDVLEVGRLCLDHCLKHQDWASVVQYGPAVLRLDPCCQASSAALMRAQIERGNAHEAFRVYEACVQALERELGVPAGPELRAVHELALGRFPD